MDESLMPKELRTQKEPETPKAKKAIAGNARVNKSSGLRKKFKEAFLPEDMGSIKEFIIWDQFVPAIQNGIYDLVVGTLGMMFFGKVINRKTGPRRSNSTWRFDGEQPIAYDRINDRRPSAAARNGRRPSSAYVEEIVVDTYNDAAAVLEELIAYLEQYGRVPVSAYYDAFGVSNDRPWTDQKWGWTSLREAKVGPVRGGGYTVYLPDPEAF